MGRHSSEHCLCPHFITTGSKGTPSSSISSALPLCRTQNTTMGQGKKIPRHSSKWQALLYLTGQEMSTESCFSDLCTLLYWTRTHPTGSSDLLPSKLQTARNCLCHTWLGSAARTTTGEILLKIQMKNKLAVLSSQRCLHHLLFFTLSPGGLEVFAMLHNQMTDGIWLEGLQYEGS